jgi:predicted nicotinamide N-methyase
MAHWKARSFSKALGGTTLLLDKSPDEIRAFIVANTAPLPVLHCPDIKLHLAHEAVDLWQLTEAELEAKGLPLPFWAFAWAGGQGLARYVLDNPEIVAGKTILDMASGSGLVGIAAKIAGAAHVLCADIDPMSAHAITLNAALNQVEVEFVLTDLIGKPLDHDVILVGDLFYERDIAAPLLAWLQNLHQGGSLVLIGDPGRTYLPKDGLIALADYQVPVSRALEDADVKRTRVWALNVTR